MGRSPKAVILMYHRVFDSAIDPWGLSVTPSHFAEHLQVLKQQANPMGLAELAAAHRRGEVPERAVAVTFDDGYADNLHHATPLLEEYGIPATIFITTGFVGSSREMWWDELERVLLTPGSLPERLKLTISGTVRSWELGTAARYTPEEAQADAGTRAWDGKPGSRLAFYYDVWDALRKLPAQERQPLQDQVIQWAGAATASRESHRALTQDELVTLSQSEVIEIGAHTVTHPSLPVHSREIQQSEIQTSKAQLEQLLSREISSFSYPFGDFDRHSVTAAKNCGFDMACSTVQESVWKGSQRFQLPRYEVLDWDGNTFGQKLQHWLA